VVAATNKNMLQAVSEGKFREDLYYRLSTVQINIPPLRERGKDVLMLVRKFSNDFAEKYGTPAVQFDESAREAIMNYRWPGNVRQLKNVIEQISLFEAGNDVDADRIKKYLPQYSTEYKPTVASAPVFNYTQEREMLFKLIFKMQHEIEELHNRIDSISKIGGSQQSSFTLTCEVCRSGRIQAILGHIGKRCG
jgi:DNA-binding NtrC family response regulator